MTSPRQAERRTGRRCTVRVQPSAVAPAAAARAAAAEHSRWGVAAGEGTGRAAPVAAVAAAAEEGTGAVPAVRQPGRVPVPLRKLADSPEKLTREWNGGTTRVRG